MSRAARRAGAALPLPSPAPSSSFRLRVAGGLAVALALSAALHFLQLRHGLPEFLEEAWPFREAWDMWGWDGGRLDLNPHRFHYPSLTFYLHFLLQQAQFVLGLATGAWTNRADFFLAYHTDPSALVVAARAMGALFAMAGIAALVWMGERIRSGAGILAGLALAISVTWVNAVRAIVPDAAMAALALGALLAMLSYLREGRRAALVAAVVLIGLATGAKYPAATLLLPLALVLFLRDGRGGLARWALAATGAFAVFLFTTPFALLDVQTFWRDLGFVRQLPGAGHLGRLEGSGAAFNFGTLVRNAGPAGLALLPVSLFLTLAAWRTRREELVLWVALAGFAAPVFAVRVEAERYMTPVIPLALLLAAAALADLLLRAPARRRTALALLAAALLLVPIWLLAGAGLSRRPVSTQVLAARWLQTHAAPDQLIVQEAYGAPLHTRLRALEMQTHPLFAGASDAARARYSARRAFRAVQLPLTTVGPGTVVVRDAAGRDVTVRLAEHSVEFNHLSYDPRLFLDADWIVTTNSVRGRFMADTVRFADEAAFYRGLASTARVVETFVPGRGGEGPEITVYRSTPAFRDAVAALGPLDPLWWAATLPAEGRRELERRALPPGARLGGTVRGPGGAPAPWVHLLRPMYAGLVRPFTHPMSLYLAELGRNESARRFAAATLEVMPDDIEACLVFTTACAAEGAWALARGGIERTLATFERGAEPPPVLQMEYARILAETGDAPGARAILEALAGSSDAAVAEAAQAQLETTAPAPPAGRP
jgi:hypothetical protein